MHRGVPAPVGSVDRVLELHQRALELLTRTSAFLAFGVLFNTAAIVVLLVKS